MKPNGFYRPVDEVEQHHSEWSKHYLMWANIYGWLFYVMLGLSVYSTITGRNLWWAMWIVTFLCFHISRYQWHKAKWHHLKLTQAQMESRKSKK